MDMQEQLRKIQEDAQAQLAQISDKPGLDALKVRLMGKKGELTALLRGMGQLSPEERPAAGQMINDAREKMTAMLEEKLSACQAAQAAVGSDYVKLQELMAEQTALEEALEEKTERWVYLNELKEKIDAQ